MQIIFSPVLPVVDYNRIMLGYLKYFGIMIGFSTGEYLVLGEIYIEDQNENLVGDFHPAPLFEEFRVSGLYGKNEAIAFFNTVFRTDKNQSYTEFIEEFFKEF